jgi:predicted TIM-barrel fold metal-dependent hydrolase
MTDYHIHIGQFNDKYYDPFEIFHIIEKLSDKTKIKEIYYSSTSSCRDDVELSGIEEEINYAQSFNSKKVITKPYLWYIPKYAEQNISVESATKAFDYCGIKIHPAGQIWDENNSIHLKALHQIFKWADNNKKYILIHCGAKKYDLPTRFEQFFAEYTNAKIILAHSNPVSETAQMVNKYNNVFCDTACIQKESFDQLKKEINNTKKILFGSDFPVNNYFNKLLFNKKMSLSKEYTETCKIIKNLNYE